MSAFKFNPEAKYKIGGKYNPKHIVDGHLNISVNEKDNFKVNVIALFSKYLRPDIRSDKLAFQWFDHPLKFYQNQLNFAVWIATTGCGISYVNHLHHSNPLIQSVYRFHFYFQIRKILSEMSVPIHNEKSHNPFNNPIDLKAYERICNEFNIPVTADFRQTLDRNHGLGSLYLYKVGNPYDGPFVKGSTSFNTRSLNPLLYIKQHKPDAWTTFILDQSEGLTRAGTERLNQSIRTYVWAVLSSQAQTRADILTSFDAQKQFLANIEDAINAEIDLPSSIDRYQDSLRYARSKVDFCVGNGIYLIPSNMRLQIGTIVNYNNKIVVGDGMMKLGKNDKVNETLHVVLPSKTPSDEPQPTIVSQPTPPSSHDQTKMWLTVGLTGIGLFLLYFKHSRNK